MTHTKVNTLFASLWRQYLVWTCIIVESASLSQDNIYCNEQQTCPEDLYCDLGFHYCMPCGLICNGPMYHEGECRTFCPDTKILKDASSSPDTSSARQQKPTDKPPRSEFLTGQKDAPTSSFNTPVLYVATVSLIILCIVSVLALACYVMRRKKTAPRQQRDVEMSNFPHNATSEVIGLTGSEHSATPVAQANETEKTSCLPSGRDERVAGVHSRSMSEAYTSDPPMYRP